MTAALSLTLLGLMLVAAVLLVLAPLRGRVSDPDALERGQLEQERDRLFGELRSLPDAQEGRRPELEGRAARLLRQLDGMPPAPKGSLPAPLLWGGLALAAVLVAVGAFTFIPRWQLGGLNGSEAQTVKTALQLPGLAQRARQSGRVRDELAWGKAAFDAGQYDQAASAYAAALKQDPRQPEALRRLGIILLTRDDQNGQTAKPNDQAFLLIRTAAQLAPNDPESQLLLGFALSRYGQDTLALTALERYRSLNPQGRDADDMIAALRARQNTSDPGLSTFAANCASCHGAGGNGGIGPSLRMAGLTRDTLAAVVRNGKGTMPAFPQITGRNLTALLALVEGWQK
ncbi:c-type cytochrome [Deinococcus aquiradiocola]|uniref:Cytochrome c family protein n=1 Tax=Deinococcus aquiradiocola TaxID=393059 RepID=A0A917PML2_9DEIO|nr:cytochrome c [Deinococcus aquiradiocola]GGJ85128.1 cytochrome c family protein [Deinococcus aquiradiocola]